MPSKFGDWCPPTGLKKEFFPGPQNTETALDPYMLSSIFWIQERNILGWRRRIADSSVKEPKSLLIIEWIHPSGLELAGLQDPHPSVGKSFNCRNNPSQGSKTWKVPLLYIGRFPGNEAQRETLWASMCWRVSATIARILSRDRLPCQSPKTRDKEDQLVSGFLFQSR